MAFHAVEFLKKIKYVIDVLMGVAWGRGLNSYVITFVPETGGLPLIQQKTGSWLEFSSSDDPTPM